MIREPTDGEEEQFQYEQGIQPDQVLAFILLIGIVTGVIGAFLK